MNREHGDEAGRGAQGRARGARRPLADVGARVRPRAAHAVHDARRRRPRPPRERPHVRRAHEPSPRRARGRAARDRARRRARRRVARSAPPQRGSTGRSVPLFDYAATLGALAPHVAPRPPHGRARGRARARRRRRARASSSVRGRTSTSRASSRRSSPCAQRGSPPALGTDSLASNASLDVLAEARALADRFPSVPARELLAMATWNGARALGREDLGRIAKGAQPGDRRDRRRPGRRPVRVRPAAGEGAATLGRAAAARARSRVVTTADDSAPGARASSRALAHVRRDGRLRAHGLRAPVRGERGRLRPRRAARAAHAAARPRDARVHGLRPHERDGVQPVGRSRRRREEPAHQVAPRPVRRREARRGARAGARAPGALFLALAATLGFWPAGPRRRSCSRFSSGTRSRSASPGGRTRGSASRSRSRPVGRGSRWGPRRTRGSSR